MIESIAAGIASNFLTDFIKSCLGVARPPLPSPVGGVPNELSHSNPDPNLVARRAQNHHRVESAKAVLSVAYTFVALLAVAALLPMLARRLTGHIDLSETRLTLPNVVGTFRLGFAAWALGLPLFWVVQRVTQALIQIQHENWSDVLPRQAARLFTISCFIVLPFYSAAVVFLLFPSLGIVDSLLYPIGKV
ncbi:hypothetical protein [Lysobacter sp. N42]|uniref:hypothetical protein n=1 Tax=Lysobacter sp. N42 TaxID=2545719 RepID=UPI001047284F|nr:hypothetical protein [Lysobacter sp. N42]TCZ76922.1 hypothetical protein EYQ95_26140 [Lysobacter sp. N42]